MSTVRVNATLLETTNTKLAAALCAVGIPLRKDFPVRLMTGGKGGDSHCFFFEPKSLCGDYDTAELILAWEDANWHRNHPEHPFAYIKVAFEGNARLTDYVRRGERIAWVTKGNKIGFLSVHASDESQKRFFTELKR